MSKDHEDPKIPDEVTLKMKLEDVLDVVAKSGNRPITTRSSAVHDADGEDLKKAWFRHVLSSVEKLNTLVENVRSVDISNLKADLKDDIRKVEARLDRLERQLRDTRQELLARIDKVDAELTKKIEAAHQELLNKIEEVNRDLQAYKTTVDNKFIAAEKELSTYKKEVVDPMRMKILTISVKLGVWATVAGLVGSGLFALGGFLIKSYLGQ
jgi:DNA anti-recombination protein RmuC